MPVILSAKIVVGFLLNMLSLGNCGPERQGAPGSSAAYHQLLRTMYRHTVPTVQPAALVQELRQPSHAILLLDTRAPQEYKVSHLQGAKLVDFDTYKTQNYSDFDRDQPIVVYCSVGVRSEKVGDRLRELGFRQVRNLYGGLFEWVNAGYPVYNAAGQTTKVHPYSALWGAWLRAGQKVYE